MADASAARALGSDGPTVIHEDDALRISGIEGGDEALVVAFTGIGHRLGALQREEFVKTSYADGKHSVLFVQDKTRSWYNEPAFLRTLEPIVAAWAVRCRRTITIGNSMGGFGAVVFAGALKAETAIAFSPQYSVSPNIVPQETRWLEHRQKIAEFRYESAGPYITEACRYFVFQGDASRDWYQIGVFPIRPNLFQFVFPGGPHNLAAILRARGSLTALVDACVANDLAAITEIAVARSGAFLRLPFDDAYAKETRPRPSEPDDVQRIALPPPLAPAVDEGRLERFHQRRERRKSERLDRKRAEYRENLQRLDLERLARRETVRVGKIAARRKAAIARGAELAAERRARRRPQTGAFGKARRLVLRLASRARRSFGSLLARGAAPASLAGGKFPAKGQPGE